MTSNQTIVPSCNVAWSHPQTIPQEPQITSSLSQVPQTVQTQSEHDAITSPHYNGHGSSTFFMFIQPCFQAASSPSGQIINAAASDTPSTSQ